MSGGHAMLGRQSGPKFSGAERHAQNWVQTSTAEQPHLEMCTSKRDRSARLRGGEAASANVTSPSTVRWPLPRP